MEVDFLCIESVSHVDYGGFARGKTYKRNFEVGNWLVAHGYANWVGRVPKHEYACPYWNTTDLAERPADFDKDEDETFEQVRFDFVPQTKAAKAKTVKTK